MEDPADRVHLGRGESDRRQVAGDRRGRPSKSQGRGPAPSTSTISATAAPCPTVAAQDSALPPRRAIAMQNRGRMQHKVSAPGTSRGHRLKKGSIRWQDRSQGTGGVRGPACSSSRSDRHRVCGRNAHLSASVGGKVTDAHGDPIAGAKGRSRNSRRPPRTGAGCTRGRRTCETRVPGPQVSHADPDS